MVRLCESSIHIYASLHAWRSVIWLNLVRHMHMDSATHSFWSFIRRVVAGQVVTYVIHTLCDDMFGVKYVRVPPLGRAVQLLSVCRCQHGM